jgi:hypothetical protein
MSNPDNRFETIFANIRKARTAITDKHGLDRGYQGLMDCPICGTGKLHYSCANSNGHIHAKCDSGNCVSWME